MKDRADLVDTANGIMASHPNKMSSTMPASNPYSGYRRKLAWGNHSMNQLTHGFSSVSRYRTTAGRNTFPSILAWGQGAGVVTRIWTVSSHAWARKVAKLLLVLVSWVYQGNRKAGGGEKEAVTGLLRVISILGDATTPSFWTTHKHEL